MSLMGRHLPLRSPKTGRSGTFTWNSIGSEIAPKGRRVQASRHNAAMTPWTVRAVRPEDAFTIALHRYHREDLREDLNAYATWVPDRIASGAYIGFLAEHDGLVIGGAGALLLDWGPTRGAPSPVRARLMNVFTEEPWRQQGVAGQLVDEVMAACTAMGVQVFILAASAGGLHMYKARGFVPYENEMVLRR